ncbi:L,D-transpeptidase family protein [Ramlibacter sp. H39-3-26]|uniref:L,D-transpeptidase family protein n=1 Tax=Curvibacter soli TaxID=3031331 RepID=UPI0023DC2598|nr:L,D-transpeptidase family protein [Ramlibacter sp. H39-3-26]MDF1485286.1 L,D-transpeptidase family protein [Ramlibacter sp. H39-3-26]
MNLRHFLQPHLLGRWARLAVLLPTLAAQAPLTHAKEERRHRGGAPARASAPAAAPATTPLLRDGKAEARLLDIQQLASQGRSREALALADALVRDHPNFQLAQLVLGDLLTARTRPAPPAGKVPGDDVPALPSQAQAGLQALREEWQMRVAARHRRPPAGSLPEQFLALSPRNRHAIAVDTSRSRLYLFENTGAGLALVADYYASVGKLGIGKSTEGDLRTPLGVYFITSRLDPATLKDFYGAGALPINYPNPLDQRRGKTGSGIWLHGSPPDQFVRAPLSTDGCVALSNPDLERIVRTVEPRSTPVVIARELRWVAPASIQDERHAFEAVLDAWRSARSRGDMRQVASFYAPDFSNYRYKTLDAWLPALQAQTQALKGREIQLKDMSYLRWTDSADTMVVTFGEVPAGARTGPVKRQYWTRRGNQWQIFFEGVIG